MLPMHGPSLHQNLLLIARKDEYGKTPAHLASIGRAILREHYVPKFAELAPWLSGCVTIQKPKGGMDDFGTA
jgi:hypothetical protein